jgi:hypothetical protein
MSGVVRGIAVAPTVGVERYAVLDDMALADCAVEIEGRDTDDLFETAGMALGAHGRASDGQGVDRAAVVDLHPLEISRKFISLTLISNHKG